MLKVLGTLTATAIILGAGTAFAGSSAAPNSHKKVRAEWAMSRAQGGYGFPLTSVPIAIGEAVDDAINGNDTRGQAAQVQPAKTQN
ncbi:MAG: hypothetical protein ACTSVG_01345 [Alphaproteobacteria bacterium]